MTDSVYQVFTPAGIFHAVFGDDEQPVVYLGDELAIKNFKNWINFEQISGVNGIRVNPDTLDPNTLYGFCQPTGSGNIVMPPFDDMLMFTEDDQPETALDCATTGIKPMQTGMQRLNAIKQHATFDSATGAEKLKLVKELRDRRNSMAGAKSGAEKLQHVKRIKDIRGQLGVKATVQPDTTKPKPSDTLIIKSLFDVKPGWMAKLMSDGYRVLSKQSSSFGGDEIFIADNEGTSFSFKMRPKQSLKTDISGLDSAQMVIVNKLVEYGAAYFGKQTAKIPEPTPEPQPAKQTPFEKGYNMAKDLGRMPVFVDDWIADPSDKEMMLGFDEGAKKWLSEQGQVEETPQPATIPGMEQETQQVDAFTDELTALQSETDIPAYLAKLEEIAGRVEAADLSDVLDAKLNFAADVLTQLMADAEK